MAASAQNNDYAELRRRIKQAGLLKKQPAYYIFNIFFTFGLLAMSVAFLVLVDSMWLQFMNAAFLAFVFVHIGMLMHDTDHRQIFSSNRMNELFGIMVGNLILGVSSSSWTKVHNQHHGAPNHVDIDGDIDIPILAYSEEQAMRKRGLARFIVRYQAYFWFLLLLSLVAYTLRIAKFFEQFPGLRTRDWKRHLVEIVTVCIGVVMYVGFIFYFVGGAEAIIFLMIHNALLGLYFGTIFATNHKGMPLINRRFDFLRMQVLTARNVRGNPLIDFWMGGLNYQIEHHLFPTMPRNNLKKARLIVMEFCAQHSIDYYETGFFASYGEILRHFHKVSAPLRAGATSQA